MGLFTCKKYHFVVKKNLPSFPASRLNDLLPTGRSSPTTQNQGNSGTTLPKGRVVGPDRFTEDCRNSDRFIFGFKYLWVGMLESNTLVSYSPKLSYDLLTLN